MLTLSSITKVVTSKAFVVGASIATGLFVVGAIINNRKLYVIGPKKGKTKDDIIQEATKFLKTYSEKPKEQVSSEVLKESEVVNEGLNKETEALKIEEAIETIKNLTSDEDIKDIMVAVENGDIRSAADKSLEVATNVAKKVKNALSENKSGTCSAASDHEPFNQIRFKSKKG